MALYLIPIFGGSPGTKGMDIIMIVALFGGRPVVESTTCPRTTTCGSFSARTSIPLISAPGRRSTIDAPEVAALFG